MYLLCNYTNTRAEKEPSMDKDSFFNVTVNLRQVNRPQATLYLCVWNWFHTEKSWSFILTQVSTEWTNCWAGMPENQTGIQDKKIIIEQTYIVWLISSPAFRPVDCDNTDIYFPTLPNWINYFFPCTSQNLLIWKYVLLDLVRSSTWFKSFNLRGQSWN